MIGYARIDQDSRLLEWNWEPWDGLDIEIGNAEIIDQLCRNGIEDFVVRDSMAHFEPTPEKAAQYAKEDARQGLTAEDILAMMVDSVTVAEKPASKEGFITTPNYNAEGNSIVWTFEPDPNYTPTEDGSYLHPFTYTDGMEVAAGMFYTDGEDIWEAIKDGTPSSFADEEYFDIIR